MWNAKKISKGVRLKKISVEKQKWKVLGIAWNGEKGWKKGVKIFDRHPRRNLKKNEIKKLDNWTKWRDLKFHGARTNGLEDIQVWN